jgi:hypothetical protein
MISEMLRLTGSPFRRMLGLLLVVVAGVFPASVAAQALTGVIRDAATGEGIPQARVAVEREGRATATVVTDRDGWFRIRAEGGSPATLTVDRIGYVGVRFALERNLAGPDGIEILLERRPVELPGIDAEVERERLELRVAGWLVTEQGLFPAGRVTPAGGRIRTECFWRTVDSVVVRDPRLYLPEVTTRYEPARSASSGIQVGRGLRPSEIPDSRLRRDAWPCGVVRLERRQGSPYVVRRPTPERAAPAYALEPAHRHRLPAHVADPRTPGALAVHTDGRLAVLSADGTTVEVVSHRGATVRSVPLGWRESGPGGISHRLGWLGDALWVADQVGERLILIPPEPARPEIREREGVLAPVPEGPILSPVDETLAAPLGMDRPAPVPIGDGRFLWTRPAPDAPYPPRHPKDPPSRFLVVLNGEWRVERVLATLRPGAEGVDVELGSRPVIGEQPFRDPPLWALSPEGGHVTLVEREHQVAAWMSIYRVVRLNLDGDTIFAVERPAPMIRISDEVFEAARDELAARPGAADGLGTGPMSRAVVGALLYRPPFHPPISALVVGWDGSTWLRWPDEGSGPVRWDVLAGDGRPLRTLELPAELRILAADEAGAWGAVPMQGGGFEVVRYELRPVDEGSRR